MPFMSGILGERAVWLVMMVTTAAKRKVRRGVNPRTRESMNIPAKKVPKFVPGKNLKNKVK